jgi:putative membrane-bound dehydrogenase-like protein
VTLWLAIASWFAAADPIPPKQPDAAPKGQQVSLNGHTFTLPEGFEIELVAAAPLVDRPITAAFDEQGRLYVADSSGSNEKTAIQVEKKPHRIVRLEDTDGDGKFDKSSVFADRMMFPEGTMWFAGSLYVAAPPSIWKLTDTDGDGKADQRQEWFEGKTLTGCANDLHGPYLGPDGWIYWAKGAFAKQTYERPGKKPFTTRASHIFRCRPDGSGLEPVMTGGMDNPVDVVFTPGGERIFTTTFFQHPGDGKRDGLIHAVYGGIYGKDHDPVYEHPWTSPALMPVLTHFGPAAPAGLHRYASSAFGPDHADNLFAVHFNMRKVSRHVLVPDGATFRTQDHDFLVSNNHDFHPTDVIEDADGSLLVIDTGGWYKLCCPTSQLVKPDVLGGIYRIRKKGTPKVDDPRGLKLPWKEMEAAELTRLLGDPRPAVRQRAIETLADKGQQAAPVLQRTVQDGNSSVEARRNAVWASCWIDDSALRAIARLALEDRDESVRQAALHVISVRRDPKAVTDLQRVLKQGTMPNRRAAAEALGRIGDRSAVPVLLEALASRENDRILDHSLTYALMEIADPQGTAAGLKGPNPKVRRAVLTALDQMEGGKVDVKTIAAEMTAQDESLKETAAWIAGRHPEWGGELAGHFRERLTGPGEPAPSGAGVEELARQLSRFAGNEAIQTLLADCVQQADKAPVPARTALRAMAQGRLKQMPERWLVALTAALSASDDLVREAIITFRALPPAKTTPQALTEALIRIGKDERRPESTRLSALAAVPPGLLQVENGLFDLLLARLDREQPVAARSTVVEVLTRSALTADQRIRLAGALKGTGPMEVVRLLDAFTRTNDEKVGLALVAALHEPSVRAGLRTEVVKPRLEKYGAAVQREAAKLYESLDASLAGQRAKLEQLLGSMKNGDIRRGQLVFNSPKAVCASCHKIGYVGGTVGPDLTRIGKIRNERDLLESIVFPSASFVRSYEPVSITTRAGKQFNGVIRRDAPDEIALALNGTEEVRINRNDIEEMHPSTISIMPAGLDQQLTLQELADLVAFLKACQ